VAICSVCRTEFYRESEIDPAERCWCGDMATGPLWEWDRWRAYRLAVRYRAAQALIRLSEWLTRAPRERTEG